MFEFMQRAKAAAEAIGELPPAPLRDLDELRERAYVATATMISRAGDYWEGKVAAADGDGITERAVFADLAVLFGVSRTNARQMVSTVNCLRRLPDTEAAFLRGEIDYPKARVICAVLDDASDAACRRLDATVLSAARQQTPGPLRSAVWSAWMKAAPDEAEKARQQHRKSDRTVYTREGDNGMAWLSACLTDLEGAEALTLIVELADSVCSKDPRSGKARRADALMALLHGDGFIRCECEDPECALATSAPPPRRTHLLQILVDIETLLGLSANPAHLPDGTPIAPEVVRTLATDATWQAILVEMRTAARQYHPEPTPDTANAHDTATAAGGTDATVSEAPATSPGAPGTAAPKTAGSESTRSEAAQRETNAPEPGQADTAASGPTQPETTTPGAGQPKTATPEPTQPDGTAPEVGQPETAGPAPAAPAVATEAASPVPVEDDATWEPVDDDHESTTATVMTEGPRVPEDTVPEHADASDPTVPESVPRPVQPEPEPPTAPQPEPPAPCTDDTETADADDEDVPAAACEPARPDGYAPRGGAVLPDTGWPITPIAPGEPWPCEFDDRDLSDSPWPATAIAPTPAPASTVTPGEFAARIAAGDPCPGMPVSLLDDADAIAFVDPTDIEYAPLLLRADFVVTLPDFSDLTDPTVLGGPAYLAAGRTRPGTVLPAPAAPPTPVPPPTGPYATAYERVCLYVTMTGLPGPDDGHGGHTSPPPGALRYKPSTRLATLVRATWPTCTFPYCNVPAAKCELDHRLAFDHDDPARGGWTILENLGPLCKHDHDLKSHRHWTCRPVPGGLVWTNGTGLMLVVTPTSTRAYGVPNTPVPDLQPARHRPTRH